MRNYTMRLSVLVVAVVVTLFTSCSTEDSVGSVPAPNPNIAQIIAQDPNFSVLNAAVNKAGLSSALSSGNLTLFAPDNAAFGASGITDVSGIPASTLQAILTYHVVPRRIPSANIPYADSIKTLNLQNIFASNSQNGKFVNGIGFSTVDRQGANGYIHVVKRVLTPPNANKSIASYLANDTTFSQLYRAVVKLNLLAVLNDPNKLTVFAPNNAAFRAVGITDVDAIPTALLEQVVKAHVVGLNIAASDLRNTMEYATLEPSSRVSISTTPAAGVRLVSSVRPVSLITAADNICTNGIIHTINRVLLK